MNSTIVNIISAWLTPVVAIVAIVFPVVQVFMYWRKRRDELFDKRFEFYQKLERYWVKTSHEDVSPCMIEDLIPFATEASFLFGKKIMDHIFSLEDKKATNPFFADDDFAKPFKKYLSL